MQVLLYKNQQPPTLVDVLCNNDVGLKEIYNLIDCSYVEAVTIGVTTDTNNRVVVLLDEEGKITSPPKTESAYLWGDCFPTPIQFVGDFLVCCSDKDGCFIDITGSAIEMANKLIYPISRLDELKQNILRTL